MNDKQTPCHFMTLFNLGSLVNLPTCYQFYKPTTTFIIYRDFNVVTNFPFTTSETMRDYYSQTWYIRVAFPVVHCFKRKLELVSNILWMVVASST